MSATARWVHRRLLDHYGHPTWESNYAPVHELLGPILSQHTPDVNSERAFRPLMTAFTSWEAVRDAPVDQLTETIRRGRLAVIKAHPIQALRPMLTNSHARVHLPALPRS